MFNSPRPASFAKLNISDGRAAGTGMYLCSKSRRHIDRGFWREPVRNFFRELGSLVAIRCHPYSRGSDVPNIEVGV